MTVSPEPPGHFRTNKRRRQAPAKSAVRGLKKIRFMVASHLTIERFGSTRRSDLFLTGVPYPRREDATLHERTQAHLLRRRETAVAAYSSAHGNQRSSADVAFGVFLRDGGGQCGAPIVAAARFPARLPRRQEKELETGGAARRAAQARCEHRSGAGRI